MQRIRVLNPVDLADGVAQVSEVLFDGPEPAPATRGVSPGVDGTSGGEASLNFRTGLTSPRPGVLILPENANRRVIEIR